jgi:mannose-6-phosphate isomerase class I
MDFPIKTKNSNISEIRLTKRYPERGFVLNEVSEMVVYVLKGKVILNIDKKNSTLEKGSVVLVKKNQKYYWTPKSSAMLLIFSTPPWTPEQQKTVGL